MNTLSITPREARSFLANNALLENTEGAASDAAPLFVLPATTKVEYGRGMLLTSASVKGGEVF